MIKRFEKQFAHTLNNQPNMRCEIAEESVEKFMRLLYPDKLPDVILMDIGLPGMSGISGIKLIKERFPDIDILMLTVHNDPHKIFQSLCAGATGYLLKTTPLTEIKKFIEELIFRRCANVSANCPDEL